MSKELMVIKVNEGGKKIVSAKELYLGLGLVKANWTKWYPINIQNNNFFVENVDWVGFVVTTNGNETLDFAISIDFAKHIAMMAKTEKSHEYRNYFIECEKQLQALLPKNYAEALRQLACTVEAKELAEQETRLREKQLQEQKPLVTFAETVLKSKDNILIRELAKLASTEGISIGQNRLYIKLREWNLIFQDSTEPYQSALDRNLFVVTETSIDTAYGTKLASTTKVTPKGQVYIIERLKVEEKKMVTKI